MKTRTLTLIVVFCIGLMIWVADAFSATADTRKKLQVRKRMILPETEVGIPKAKKAIDVYRSLGGKYVGCEDIDPPSHMTIREHVSVGTTWRDYQSNSTIGRRMGVMYQNAFRHFMWSYMEGETADHYVYANCYDPWTPFWTDPQPVDGGPGRSSAYPYAQLMEYDPATGLRKEIPGASYHNYTGGWYTMLAVDDDECEGGWSRHWDVPDWVCGCTVGGYWPRCRVVHVPITKNTGRDYFHIVVNETTGLYRLGWVRCYINASNQLITETYHNGEYKMYTSNEGELDAGPLVHPIALVDTVCFIDPVVETSPVSKRVVIVYTSAVANDHANETDGCDVGYVEDMNNGEGWLAGNPFVFYNITNYPGGCTDIVERAFIDLGACYDYEDSLHIAYITTLVPCPAGGSYYPQYAWVYHWSKKTGSRMIQYYEETEDIHSQNEAGISKISISAKDPIYHPDEGMHLFCTWTQVDSADVSADGFGNRDIFACVSTDGGTSWGRVWNLTNTQTPGCSPGECVSEGWPSLAQNMYNGDLHIQYICDRDAGPCVWDEGAWTDNPVYYLQLYFPLLPPPPCFEYRIDEPPEPPHWNKPPLRVPKLGETGDRNVYIKAYNCGNTIVEYSVTDDQPVCIETPGAMPPLTPGDSVLIPITIKGSGGCESTFVGGNVIITINHPDSPVIYLPIQAVVAVEDYYECPRTPETEDTVENSIEGVQSGLTFYTNANCQEWFHYYDPVYDTTHEVGFQGGIIVATIRDNDTLVGRCMGENDHKADAQDSLYVRECADAPGEPDFWLLFTKDIIINDLDPPSNDKWFCWTISEQVKFFKPTAPEPYRNIIIKHVRVKRQAPPGWWPGGTTDCTDYGDTYVGIAMDIDCPWDTMGYQNGRNLAGYDNTNHIAYQQGWEISGIHPEWNDFYCGIALAEQTDDTLNYQAIAPYGAFNVRNDVYLYPQSPWGWKDGELYQLALIPGIQIVEPDSMVDRTQVFTALEIPTGSDPDAEVSFTLVEAVAPGGLADLQDKIDLARFLVAKERKLVGIPANCADCNGDYIVELGDLLYLTSYLYKGGDEPLCPIERGDVNSDGIIDLGDVLYLISYLYKGGPEPVCPGIWFFE